MQDKPYGMQPDAGLPTGGSDCSDPEVRSQELHGSADTLVLYDTDGDTGYLGELTAAALGTLASHFGTWKAAPVDHYQARDMDGHTAVIYVGSSYDQPLPRAFLQDVAESSIPVLWLDQNIWQLQRYLGNFEARYGFDPGTYDNAAIPTVRYKGVLLDRDATNESGVMTYKSVRAPSVTLATAQRADGTELPWAIRSGNLTYVGENPLAYVGTTDRYLALCDMLFDVLGQGAVPERHRALIRLEDVSAQSDPQNLRAIADYLASEAVPFSIATIPQYIDPHGTYNQDVPLHAALREAPELVAALKYMIDRNGTAIMHGYTHQHDDTPDPYTGVSGDDFEFYETHIDADNDVIYDGPVAEDSVAWAAQRFDLGLREFSLAGLPRPSMFEWPHYAASDKDNQALRHCFAVAYHQPMYFTGVLTGAAPDYQRNMNVFAPYVTMDAYGFEVIPENLGLYSTGESNQNPPHSADDIVRAARANLVVRDGFASFFFHPFFSVDELKPIIEGIKAAGYEFVAASDL